MYSTFSEMSCKVVVTVASGEDSRFFEKVNSGIMLASSICLPTRARRWLDNHEESILEYSSIIIFLNNFANMCTDEYLGLSLAQIIPDLIERNRSPLSEEKVLLCKETNIPVISAFCDYHQVPIEKLIILASDISYWSTFLKNKATNQLNHCKKRNFHLL